MGAVPGGRLLNGAAPSPWFDVESFRSSADRTVVVRRAGHAALVLGSTQPGTSVDSARAARAGIEVVRRRSGGGAVLVGPGDPVWIDVWLPRGDPLWHDDVGARPRVGGGVVGRGAPRRPGPGAWPSTGGARSPARGPT